MNAPDRAETKATITQITQLLLSRLSNDLNQHGFKYYITALTGSNVLVSFFPTSPKHFD